MGVEQEARNADPKAELDLAFMIFEGVRFFGVVDDRFCRLYFFLGVDDADIRCWYNFASMARAFCSLSGTGGKSKL